MGDRAETAANSRIGIVGAGRTRQGLGPFFAQAFVAAGCRVTGVSGRDLAGAERAARELATSVGHPVAAHPDAASLARSVEALVVAAPVPGHLAGLDAELAVLLLNENEWGRDFDRAARAVLVYGAAAKAVLPRLEKETRPIAGKDEGKMKPALAALVEKIKAAPPGKPLRTVAEFQAASGQK